MKCRLVVAIAGMPGAGKSIIAEVARSMGIPVVRLGDVVREEAYRRGLSGAPLHALADELRRLYGMEVMAVRATDKLIEACSSSCLVVVDGVRCLEEIKYIEREMGVKVVILAVHAPRSLRFERLIKRGRPDDPKTWEEFLERDLRELSWGLGNVIALADYVVSNEGGLDEFKAHVHNLLSEVRSRWCM